MSDRRGTGGGAWLRTATAISLAVGLASCGPVKANEQMSSITLEEAKTKVLSLQHRIIGMVPKELVIDVFENDTSSLMPCDGDAKKWAGTGQVELHPGMDRQGFLDEVRSIVSGEPGWTAKDRTDGEGEHAVDLLHEDGTHLIVGFWNNPESLQVDSFSACFEFPQYQYGEKY